MAAFRSLTACKMGRERPRWVGVPLSLPAILRRPGLLPAERTPPTLDAGDKGHTDKLFTQRQPRRGDPWKRWERG